MGFVATRKASLGDYNDGRHTWHYDAAAGGYIDENGNPSGGPAPNAQTPANFELTGDYGSTPNAAGGYTYSAVNNPFLIQHPSGTGADGNTTNYNPNFYATAAAAQQFAAAFGGTVVIDPNSKGIDGTPMYAIRLPGGTTVNAGAIAQILGNDAAYGNDNAKSGEIAKLFGAGYQPGLAESLVGAAGTATRLTASGPAPGYNPTPLNQSIVDAAKKAAPSATAAAANFTAAAASIAEQFSTAASAASLPSWVMPAAAAVALIFIVRKVF